MNMPSNDVEMGVKPNASANNGTNRRKLGRGLGALMGEIRKEESLVGGQPNNTGNRMSGASSGSASGELIALSLAEIEPLPDQPRTRFDEKALDELAASIAARGVIQPIIVTPHNDGKYRLVAGERRWRAARKAHLETIPAIVRTLDVQEVMAIALIENLQREDLNPVEEARAYQRLSDIEDMTQADIAKLVDKSRSHVANMQRLLALPAPVLTQLADGDLSMGHARALIGHDHAEALANQAIEDNLSVRDVERLVRSSGETSEKPRRKARQASDSGNDADITAVQKHLEEFLGLPVKIKPDGDPRSGNVTIAYRTLDQLDLICQRLTGGDI